MKPFLEKILKDAAKIDYESVFQNEKKQNTNKASDEECQKFLKTFADTQGLPDNLAFLALTTLFTKGICNKSAPGSMSTIITNPNDQKTLEIKKIDVVLACKIVCKHQFIRRIATALAEEVCTCAERHQLEGDLSKRIDKNLLAKGEPRLTPKEKAWANSFCQDLENLESYSSARLPKLLAEDYSNRFNKNEGKSKKNNQQNKNVQVLKDKKENLAKEKGKNKKKNGQTNK